jgi:hypothetical protein
MKSTHDYLIFNIVTYILLILSMFETGHWFGSGQHFFCDPNIVLSENLLCLDFDK